MHQGSILSRVAAWRDSPPPHPGLARLLLALPLPLPPLQRLPRDLLSGVWLRRSSLPAALYMLLTVAFPAAGLAFFLAPNVRGWWQGALMFVELIKHGWAPLQ